MPINYFLTRDSELAVQEEATYGTSPGALVGADFFKHTSSHVEIAREFDMLPRDMDRDNNQASILNVYQGRKRSKIGIKCKVIPSGNASTPTAPDADSLYKANLGTKHTATAHTTTAAGSAGTTLNLTPGGGAASGLLANDLIAVDVSAPVGYEVRRVVSIATDVITLDRAFTVDPAAARTVKVGITYKLLESALPSVYLWLFNGDDLRYAVPGVVVPEMELSFSFADNVPTAEASWSGMGKYEVTQSTSRPTPVTAGQWLTPSIGKAWVGTAPGRFCIVSASLKVNNGIELRETDSCGLDPTGPKRTGNAGGRYLIEQSLEMFMTTGDQDVKALYDAAATLTLLNSMIQVGDQPGNIIAWTLPAWKPVAERTDQGGEVGAKLSGRAVGTTGDDEVFLAFL